MRRRPELTRYSRVAICSPKRSKGARRVGGRVTQGRHAVVHRDGSDRIGGWSGAAGRTAPDNQTAVRRGSRILPAVGMARLTGAALLSLGAACWWARHDRGSAASKAIVGGMLIYNAAV